MKGEPWYGKGFSDRSNDADAHVQHVHALQCPFSGVFSEKSDAVTSAQSRFYPGGSVGVIPVLFLLTEVFLMKHSRNALVRANLLRERM